MNMMDDEGSLPEQTSVLGLHAPSAGSLTPTLVPSSVLLHSAYRCTVYDYYDNRTVDAIIKCLLHSPGVIACLSHSWPVLSVAQQLAHEPVQ